MSVKKSYNRRPPYIRWAILLFGVLGFLFMISFGREYVSNLQIQRELTRLEEERSALQSQRAEQLLELQRLSSTYYLEREAREKHGMAGFGEEVFIVKEDPFSVRNTVEVEVPEEEAPLPIWRQWLNYFFVQDSSEQVTYEDQEE